MNGNTVVEKMSLRKLLAGAARGSRPCPDAAIFAAETPLVYCGRLRSKLARLRGQQAEDEHRDEAGDAEACEHRDDLVERPGREHAHDPDHGEHDERGDEPRACR